MATTAPLMWLDGAMVASETAGAPLMGHAAQRGSLVFDVGSFRETARGPALFRAPEHVVRFLRSASIVGLELAFDEAALVDAAVRVAAESGRTEGLVRWSAFLRAREPDLLPRNLEAHVAVAALSLDPPRRQPLAVAFFDDARKAPPEVLSPLTKAAGAYLGPMIAKRRAVAAGADDVVLLDREGNIAEAPVANVFAVVSGALWTPPLTYVLPGITRDSVIAIARDEGIAVKEEPLPCDVFASADEAFLTSTSLDIAPIGSINGNAVGVAPGPITKRLFERLDAAGHGRDPARAGWLTSIR